MLIYFVMHPVYDGMCSISFKHDHFIQIKNNRNVIKYFNQVFNTPSQWNFEHLSCLPLSLYSNALTDFVWNYTHSMNLNECHFRCHISMNHYGLMLPPSAA